MDAHGQKLVIFHAQLGIKKIPGILQHDFADANCGGDPSMFGWQRSLLRREGREGLLFFL